VKARRCECEDWGMCYARALRHHPYSAPLIANSQLASPSQPSASQPDTGCRRGVKTCGEVADVTNRTQCSHSSADARDGTHLECFMLTLPSSNHALKRTSHFNLHELRKHMLNSACVKPVYTQPVNRLAGNLGPRCCQWLVVPAAGAGGGPPSAAVGEASTML
jgi:hypothetical protein